MTKKKKKGHIITCILIVSVLVRNYSYEIACKVQ